jgi:ABC-type Fe3+ transport system permease subunit
MGTDSKSNVVTNYNVGTLGYSEQIFVRQTSGSQSQREVMIQKTSRRRQQQQQQVSKLMIFSLVVMIAGFIMATPLSLILTIPAYVLADKVSHGTNSILPRRDKYSQ